MDFLVILFVVTMPLLHSVIGEAIQQDFNNIQLINTENMLYIGTFTPKTGFGEGIYQFTNDKQTGNWTFTSVTTGIGSPSFIITTKYNTRIYAVHELYHMDGEIGYVSAYAVDQDTGKIQFINSQPSAGNGPTHLALDPSESFLIVAHFGTGNVVVFPLDSNGGLEPISDNILPKVKAGISPGAHMVTFDPNYSNRVAVVFYGMDTVLFYQLDILRGKLSSFNIIMENGDIAQLQATVSQGSGSRHMTYSKNGGHFYVINELKNTISVFDISLTCNGSYVSVQTISTLPVSSEKVSYAGGIALHPNGRFLYASNRGHDSIAVFSVHRGSGILTPIQYMPCNGAYPRHFALSRKGDSIVIANQNSGNVVEYLIDETTGYLTSLSQVLQVPTPTCALLINSKKRLLPWPFG